MKERLKKLITLSPLKITLFIIFLALILFFMDFTFLRFMELKALDLRMVSRGKIASGGETIIVTIDEKSLSELGRWPWPRTVMAKLVDQLKAYGAKVVGFDIIFSEIILNKPSVVEIKIIKNIPKPKKQAGYPRKYGQGELKAQVEVKSFIALIYPENNNPAKPRKNIVFK